jgi:hypothetical protein
MEVAVLELAWTISSYAVAGSIIVRASRECVLSGVFMVKGPTRSTQTMTQGSDLAVLGGKRPYFLRSFFVNWQTGQVEQKRSTSCDGPGHVIVFLIVCSVQACPG